jgi:hypothetical protein
VLSLGSDIDAQIRRLGEEIRTVLGLDQEGAGDG